MFKFYIFMSMFIVRNEFIYVYVMFCICNVLWKFHFRDYRGLNMLHMYSY